MSLEKILENWDEYDNLKKKGIDSRFFSCNETWEVDYLVRKIIRVYPNVAQVSLRLAITECYRTVPSPRPRRNFVQCVLQRLGLI